MADPTYLAIDWGTTNRRIYAIDAAGSVLATEQDGRGVLSMAGSDFESELAAIRARHGDVPIIAAGMVGSARGWREVPYIPCPFDLDRLAARLHWVEPGRGAIVPGLSIIADGRADVIRSEEVQMLGVFAAGLVPERALLCLPGTHCKWVRMRCGWVDHFRSAMTGELFALLRQHSLLADVMADDAQDGPAFRNGLAQSARMQLLGDIFGVRASGLLGLRPRAEAASYASGLLIGADIREQQLAAGEIVHLLSSGPLAELYAAALEVAGHPVVKIDSHRAFIAGITRIWRQYHGQ